MSGPDPLLDRLETNVQAVTDTEKAACMDSLATARVMVDRVIASWDAQVPDEPRDQAVIEVASDLYFRRTARNGVMSVTDSELQPFRINRDPLASARPILRPWLPAGMGVA